MTDEGRYPFYWSRTTDSEVLYAQPHAMNAYSQKFHGAYLSFASFPSQTANFIIGFPHPQGTSPFTLHIQLDDVTFAGATRQDSHDWQLIRREEQSSHALVRESMASRGRNQCNDRRRGSGRHIARTHPDFTISDRTFREENST